MLDVDVCHSCHARVRHRLLLCYVEQNLLLLTVEWHLGDRSTPDYCRKCSVLHFFLDNCNLHSFIIKLISPLYYVSKHDTNKNTVPYSFPRPILTSIKKSISSYHSGPTCFICPCKQVKVHRILKSFVIINCILNW